MILFPRRRKSTVIKTIDGSIFLLVKDAKTRKYRLFNIETQSIESVEYDSLEEISYIATVNEWIIDNIQVF